MEERKNEMPVEDGLDIFELLRVMWDNKFIILACMIVVAGLMFVKTMYFTDDTYTADGVLYVSNKKDVYNESDSISKSDIDTSRTLSTTYIEILKTRSFLTDISNATGGEYSWKQIKNMVKISSLNDTELLEVSVTAKSSADAYGIVDAIMKNAPEKLISIYKSGEVEVVDVPIMPIKPDGRGMVKNIAIGLVVGLVLGAGIAFVRGLFDRKIHKSEDVAKRYDVSILGELSQ